MPQTADQAGSPPVGPQPTSSLWRSPNFLKYIAAGGLNSFALQLVALTVGWQIYELTRNPLDLGLAGLAQAGPIFVLFLLAGFAADRLNRRAVLSTCSLIHALVAGSLVYYASTGNDV